MLPVNTRPARTGAIAIALAAPLPLFAQTGTAPTPVLPTVEVSETNPRDTQSYQGGTTRLGKLDQLPKDVPQGITIISDKLLFETNADTLKDAVRHVSGLTFNAGEGGRIGDNMTLRGFYSFGDLYLDGIRDVAQYNRETFDIEQLEVLRGSAAMLFGRGQAGGVINRVSKPPRLVDRTTLTTTIGTQDYGRVVADMNKVTGQDAALRVNLMKTEGGSTRDDVQTNREGIAPSFRWGIGTTDEFSVGALYLKTRNTPDYGVPFYKNRPLDVSGDTFYGTTSDYEDNETTLLTGSWKHRVSSDTVIRSLIRAADYQRDVWLTAPRLQNPTDATVADGTAVVRRSGNHRGGEEHTLTVQSDLSTKFATGALKHEVLGGVEFLKERAARWTYRLASGETAPVTTVGNPNSSPAMPASYGNTEKLSRSTYSGDTISVFAQDAIEFLPGWKVLLGIRHDKMNADYSNGAVVDYGENSYRSSLSFQPDDTQHYYLSWTDSFNPTADLYQFSTTTETYPAERSRSLELGAKWDLYEGDLSLRAAVYRAEKDWERNTDIETASTNALLSKKRHTNGIELEAAGRITSRWEVFFGWTAMDAKVDEAAPGRNPNIAGMRPRNTPPFAWNLWTTYKLDAHWKIGGGIEAKGPRLAYGVGGSNPITPNVAPGYRRVDAMVAYEMPKYTLKANLLNVFDTLYYSSVYENGGHAVPGTGRALQLTAEVQF
ncbi:MAG: TonB-dependent siderophore receptor [Zoogloeaceae bacterium]|nr:TonB-dependent siderophore receptor [Rhodocyclaceae bacterium]MCP5221358.1 TonB-dependent siderophore receptor [Zoogloeaceae bacterium]